MRVIFLDIDGVLNSSAWFKSRPPRVGGEWGDEENALRAFDPKAVTLLGELIDRTAASVVLSSSWRIGAGVARIERYLAHHGLRVRFVGLTPDGSRMGTGERVTRGTEIATWISDHAAQVDSIAILDDDDDMGLLAPWLVHTQFELGLQREHVEQAAALLERDREDALRLAIYDQRQAVTSRPPSR